VRRVQKPERKKKVNYKTTETNPLKSYTHNTQPKQKRTKTKYKQALKNDGK